MEELDFDSGTEDVQCDCCTCKYSYEPAGHVVTRDLNIIRDAKLRSLIKAHCFENRVPLTGK